VLEQRIEALERMPRPPGSDVVSVRQALADTENPPGADDLAGGREAQLARTVERLQGELRSVYDQYRHLRHHGRDTGGDESSRSRERDLSRRVDELQGSLRDAVRAQEKTARKLKEQQERYRALEMSRQQTTGGMEGRHPDRAATADRDKPQGEPDGGQAEADAGARDVEAALRHRIRELEAANRMSARALEGARGELRAQKHASDAATREAAGAKEVDQEKEKK
jgi:hypothetical protein